MSLAFGIHLGTLNPRSWVDATLAADRLGFASVWVPEHLVVPLDAAGSPHRGADHPPIPSDVPMFDALGVLSHLAALTTRIRLGTHVYNIGLRHPFITGRAAATVDFLSGGRLDLGIGASWLRSEWEAVGLDFDRRGERVDEAIAVCRRLWADAVVEHHGKYFDFGPTAFEPKPVQQPLPLYIGGDGPAARRRAATVGSGWMPMNHRVEDLAGPVAEMRQAAARAGRPAPAVVIPAEVSSDADIERLSRAGVDHAIVRPWSRSSQAIPALEAFAGRFLPPPAAKA